MRRSCDASSTTPRRTFPTGRLLRTAGLACAFVPVALLLTCALRECGAVKTGWFVLRLDPAKYVRQGTDFCNPRFSLVGSARRVGVLPQRLDRTYDYDFLQLAAVEQRMAGIDRRAALRGLFQVLTVGARSNAAKHVRVLKFLQQASLHNSYLQPMYSDRTMVADPLVLLELGEMRCGHAARLAVDLFGAAGYRGRLVPLGSHVIAEIQYDGAWHYFDADLFGNGDSVKNADGTIPSVEELSRQPSRIDALPAAWEPDAENALRRNPPCRASYYYFSRDAWAKNFDDASHRLAPYAIYKRATPAHERESRAYGWDCVCEETVPRRLDDIRPSYPPGAPELESVRMRLADGGRFQVSLAWKPSCDADGDLLGYRVMVSRRSRGWNYSSTSLPESLRESRSSQAGWNSGMYEARFTVPESEIALVQTSSNVADLILHDSGDYFVTVMPYDAYGEQVGQRLYPMSEEIRIRAPAKR